MPIQKQGVEIVLSGGLDAKQSEELQSANTFSELTNLRFDKLGKLSKIPANAEAYSSVNDISGTNDPRRIDAVFDHNGSPIVITQHRGVQRVAHGEMSDLTGSGTDYRGQYPKACRVSRMFVGGTQFSKSSSGVLAASCCVVSPVDGQKCLLIAWLTSVYPSVSGQTTNFHVVVKVIDPDTGAVLAYAENGAAATMAALPCIQCAPLANGNAVVTFGRGTSAPYTISAIFYDSSTRSFSSSLSDITTDAKSYVHCTTQARTGAAADEFLIGWTLNSTNKLRVIRANPGLSVSDTHDSASSGEFSVSIIDDGTTGVLIASSDFSGNARVEKFGNSATVYNVPAAPTGYAVIAVSLSTQSYFSGSGGTYAVLAVSYSPRFTRFQHIRWDTAAPSGGIVGDDAVSTTVASHGVEVDGQSYFVLNMDTVLSHDRTTREISSALLVRVPGGGLPHGPDVIARLCHDRLAYYSTAFHLAGAGVIGNKMYFVGLSDYSEAHVMPFNTSLPQTVHVSTVELASLSMPLTSVSVGGATMVASGALFDFDGILPVETQPLNRPKVSVELENGGNLTATFNVVAVYRFIDDAGRLHRGYPSSPVTVTASSNNVVVYVTKPTLPAFRGTSQASINGRECDIELYCTEDGGTVYYLASVSGTSRKLFRDVSVVDPCLIGFDGVQPGDPTMPQLYSDGSPGSELWSEPPPSFLAIARIGDRVWGIDAEDRSRIWFSKPIVTGYAVEWNTVCTLSIADEAVGISEVNGTPTIFGKSGVWIVSGAGPNANGEGSFAPAQRLPHDVRCICPTSICKMPMGVAFRTLRGICMLDAGFALQPIGIPVDPLMPISGDDHIIKCMYDDRHNELRVIDLENGVFVYNTLEQKWSKWTTTGAYMTDAVVSGGRVWHLETAGVATISDLCRERGADEALHDLQDYGWQLATPWLRLDGASGFGRFYRATLMLRLPVQHARMAIGIAIAADFDDNNLIASQLWNDLSLVGGAAEQVIPLVVQPTTTRVSALKVWVLGFANGANPFAGDSPISLRLEMGAQPGGRRQVDQRARKG